MELAQIRMFKTVADVGSVARAAEVLHCVPSSITARIKALEAELGVALFLREGRGAAHQPVGADLPGLRLENSRPDRRGQARG